MDTFFEQMAEIFEEDTVKSSDILVDFDAWDSLTQLSIIALASETYGVTISAAELKDAKTVDGVYKLIESKK